MFITEQKRYQRYETTQKISEKQKNDCLDLGKIVIVRNEKQKEKSSIYFLANWFTQFQNQLYWWKFLWNGLLKGPNDMLWVIKTIPKAIPYNLLPADAFFPLSHILCYKHLVKDMRTPWLSLEQLLQQLLHMRSKKQSCDFLRSIFHSPSCQPNVFFLIRFLTIRALHILYLRLRFCFFLPNIC